MVLSSRTPTVCQDLRITALCRASTCPTSGTTSHCLHSTTSPSRSPLTALSSCLASSAFLECSLREILRLHVGKLTAMTEAAATALVGDAACSSAAAATRSHLASTTEAVAVADEAVAAAADVAGDPHSTTMGLVMHTINTEDRLNRLTAAATVVVGAAVDKETTVAVRLLVEALPAATAEHQPVGLRTEVATAAARLLATAAAAHLAVGMAVAPLLGTTTVDTVATEVVRQHLLEVTEATEEMEVVHVVVPRGVAEVQEDVTRTLARLFDCLS
jgi:hypothetical protein